MRTTIEHVPRSASKVTSYDVPKSEQRLQSSDKSEPSHFSG